MGIIGVGLCTPFANVRQCLSMKKSDALPEAENELERHIDKEPDYHVDN